MDERVELYFPKNRADAVGVESHLTSEGVECWVVPYGDTAYPGIVDRGRSWGVVLVSDQDSDRAKELLEQWQQAEPEDVEQAWKGSQRLTVPPSPNRGVALGVILLLLVLIAAAIATRGSF